jgi:hypothetical protein
MSIDDKIIFVKTELTILNPHLGILSIIIQFPHFKSAASGCTKCCSCGAARSRTISLAEAGSGVNQLNFPLILKILQYCYTKLTIIFLRPVTF